MCTSLEKLLHSDIACYYQPIINNTNQIKHAESLLRIHDPYKIYNVQEIVNKAKTDGWIDKLELWTIKENCKNYKQLRESGIEQININLSPTSCFTPNFVNCLYDIIAKYQVPSSFICFELTETEVVYGIKQLQEILQHLCDDGFQIAMDDFGTEQSGLLRLTQFPFTNIKIDREFAKILETNKIVKPLLISFMKFAKENGYTLTAEGIETESQKQFFIENDCDYLQGFYFSKALPLNQFLEFIKTSNQIRLY